MKYSREFVLQLIAFCATLGGFGFHVMAFQPSLIRGCLKIATPNCRYFSESVRLYRTASKWDNLVDEDDEEEVMAGPPAPPDMRYIPRNVMRQNQNFMMIREAGGKEITNDVYIPDPDSGGEFWFVGKIARISDISVEQAIARQWPLIVNHGANLRPVELYPHRGKLEVWVAPGDSELDVAYNRPDAVFQKMSPEVEGAKDIKSNMIGFQGEVYDLTGGSEMGFRTWRTDDGKPAKPEIKAPAPPDVLGDLAGAGAGDGDGAVAVAGDAEQFSDEKFRAPTEAELEKLQAALQDKNMDISQLYEEQQKREGASDS